MSANEVGFDALMNQDPSPAWRDLMERFDGDIGADADDQAHLYAAVFKTPEGQAILADLYRNFVNVTRAVPGQGAEAAFYREGAAQVVFWIAHKLHKAEHGEA